LNHDFLHRAVRDVGNPLVGYSHCPPWNPGWKEQTYWNFDFYGPPISREGPCWLVNLVPKPTSSFQVHLNLKLFELTGTWV